MRKKGRILQAEAAALAAVLVLVLLNSAPGLCGERLRILHINDLHGWLEPHRIGGGAPEEGGLARLAALAARVRREPTLFVAAGDLMRGTVTSDILDGAPVIEALNAMGLDGTAVGNHEFDGGLEGLKARAEEAAFPFFSANVSGRGTGFISPGQVLTVGTLQVGIFGLTTGETPLVAHPGKVAGISFLSPFEAASEAVRRLERTSDLVVCLSHLGLPADEELSRRVPGIDVIVGGHTHTRLERPRLVGTTVIVQAWERGALLGVLDLFTEGGRIVSYEGRLLPVDGRAGESSAAAAIVDRARRSRDERLGEVVGTAAVDFEGRRERVRGGETNLGNLVADALRRATGAEAAIVNGGSIRAGIPAGPVTVARIYDILPFEGHAVSFRLRGDEIVRALEEGLAGIERGGGGFPQVSGISFLFDPSAPAGERVREARIDGAVIRRDGFYTVATNDFLAAGGDGYRVFGGKEPLPHGAGRSIRELFAGYWRERGTISAGLDGRIGEVK